MIILLTFVVFLISLFVLYSTARHDFVLLRQNISVRYIYDKAFLILFIAFVVSRVLFVIDNGAFELLNPLKFFHIIRFAGVSVIGGYLISFATILFLFRNKKNKARIIDIYFLSFYPFIVLEIILASGSGALLLTTKIFMLILAVGFYVYFFFLHKNYSVKDGVLAASIVTAASFVTVSLALISNGPFIGFKSVISIVGIISFATSIILVVYLQKFKFRKK